MSTRMPPNSGVFFAALPLGRGRGAAVERFTSGTPGVRYEIELSVSAAGHEARLDLTSAEARSLALIILDASVPHVREAPSGTTHLFAQRVEALREVVSDIATDMSGLDLDALSRGTVRTLMNAADKAGITSAHLLACVEER